MLEKVNTVLEAALDEAGINMPNPTYDQNFKLDSSLIKELRRLENELLKTEFDLAEVLGR